MNFVLFVPFCSPFFVLVSIFCLLLSSFDMNIMTAWSNGITLAPMANMVHVVSLCPSQKDDSSWLGRCGVVALVLLIVDYGVLCGLVK